MRKEKVIPAKAHSPTHRRVKLSRQELATVIAALRLYRVSEREARNQVASIARDCPGGHLVLKGVDRLCDRLLKLT